MALILKGIELKVLYNKYRSQGLNAEEAYQRVAEIRDGVKLHKKKKQKKYNQKNLIKELNKL